MNVSLTAELESWVHDKVEGGLYKSASEVVRESLRLLREREVQRQRMLEELRGELALGVEQLDQGMSRAFTPQLVKEVKTAGRKRTARPERRPA